MLILHYNYFNVWIYRTRVAHCTFEITLLQAIMLTLLLVCSFSSTQVQKYLAWVLYCGVRSRRLPRYARNDIKCFARSGISDVAYSTLSVIEQSNAATNPYFVRNRAITRIPFRTAHTVLLKSHYRGR